MISTYDEAVEVSERALEAQNRGDLHEALALWKSVARYDPKFDHANAFEHMADIWDDLGDPEKAELAFRAAAALEPGYDIFLMNYASILMKNRKYHLARGLLGLLRRGDGPIAESAGELWESPEIVEVGRIADLRGFVSFDEVNVEISKAELDELLR